MIIDSHSHKPSPCAVCSIEPGVAMIDGNFYSIGLHPWHLTDKSAIGSVETSAADPRVVAIGETGLDKLCAVDIELQSNMLRQHALLAEKYEKPLVLHCVRAWQEIIELHRNISPRQPWMVHGFRGKPTVATSLVREGIYISIGEHFNPDSLRVTPLNMLLAETDESHLSIKEIISKMACYLEMDSKELENIMKANASKFFSV